MFRLVVYDFPVVERKDNMLDLLYSDGKYDALKEGINTGEDQEKFLYEFKGVADGLSAAEFAVEQCMETKKKKGSANFGLFTGTTSEPVYKVWRERYHKRIVDYSGDRSFNLDEYEGLDENHGQSYRRFMRKRLFRYLNLRPESTFFPDRFNGNPLGYGEYDRLIGEAGGIDIQLAGIGINGHIAFIEPFSSPYKKARKVKLDPLTRLVNARKYANGNVNEIPGYAHSVGLDTIMNLTESLYVLILGGHKAGIAKKAIEGPVTVEVPCSFAQMHGNGSFVLDGAAASCLEYRNLNRVFARGIHVEHGLPEEKIRYALDSMQEKLVLEEAERGMEKAASGKLKDNPGSAHHDFPCTPV
ncbi:MAG: glucosamine-6-phosphate deaminase [Candidatus Aenigmarchaeota archaeon]|nr:glucosamine-6-phosphate deaminase [Candidatus Aenigmarchaeota archaeon]